MRVERSVLAAEIADAIADARKGWDHIDAGMQAIDDLAANISLMLGDDGGPKFLAACGCDVPKSEPSYPWNGFGPSAPETKP